MSHERDKLLENTSDDEIIGNAQVHSPKKEEERNIRPRELIKDR